MKARKRRVRSHGRRERAEQYFSMGYPMAQSPAWRSLSGAAVKVWIELRTRFNGWNNGELFLSLDEAARLLELGKATVQRGFRELEAKGFIVKTRPGRWYGRMATLWRVTDKGTHGNPPTYDWKQWRPEPLSEKQGLGSATDHEGIATVSPKNRGREIRLGLEPVEQESPQPIGSVAGRFYDHSPIARSRSAEPLGERSAAARAIGAEAPRTGADGLVPVSRVLRNLDRSSPR